MSRLNRNMVIALVVGAAAFAILTILRFEASHPSTKDAYVTANIVQIVPQVSGPIVRLAVSDNQVVTAGDLLFEIDPRPFQIAVDSARAQVDKTGQNVSQLVDVVATADAHLERSYASLRLAEVQFERIEPLAKQGALPLQDRDKAQAQLDEARASVRKSQANLAKAKDGLGSLGNDNADTRMAVAQLENAELQLGYTKVFSPVDGLVTHLGLSIGSYAHAGSPMISLVNTASWRVVAYMREGQLHDIEPGDAAAVHLPAYPDIEIRGVVQGIGWGIEQQDGAIGQDGLPSVEPTVNWVRLAQRFPVRITIVTPDARHPLRKGMTATVRIDGKRRTDSGQPAGG
jgi:multidrug resistance efflux pump